MIGDISKAEHIYIAVGYTDMRKQIDGLSAIVQHNFNLDPFSNSVFLFCGRNSRIMKALYWEGDGFVFIKDLKMGNSNGPEMNLKLEKSHLNNSDGYLKDCLLNNLKPLKRVIHKLYCKSFIS